MTKNKPRERGMCELDFYNKQGYSLLKICGYEFIKIGVFYEGTPSFGTKKYKDYDLCINLINKELLKAGKSAYLVIQSGKPTKTDEIIYVGYYSQNLHQRWFYERNNLLYSWHSEKLDTEIGKIVKNGKDEISLWITTNPFSTDGHNISKEIEDTILLQYGEHVRLNKVGKGLKDYTDSLTVSTILNLKN